MVDDRIIFSFNGLFVCIKYMKAIYLFIYWNIGIEYKGIHSTKKKAYKGIHS